MQAVAENASPIEIAGRFLQTAPVDLAGMADAMGLDVVYDPNLPDSISGKIERAGDGFRITVNARHSDTRQRFTLAHEIAHYVLHQDMIGDGIVDNAMYRSTQLSGEHETQANRFAAQLLMPAGLVRAVYNGEGLRTLMLLTERFGVSTEAMRIRLNSLRLGP